MKTLSKIKLCSLLFFLFLFQPTFPLLGIDDPKENEEEQGEELRTSLEEAVHFLEVLEMSLEMGHPQAFMFLSNQQFIDELKSELNGDSSLEKRLNDLVDGFQAKKNNQEHEEAMQQSSQMIALIQSLQLQHADFSEVSGKWLILLAGYTFYRKTRTIHEFEKGEIGKRSWWALHQVSMLAIMGMFAWNAYKSITPKFEEMFEDEDPGVKTLYPMLKSGITGLKNIGTAFDSGGSSELYRAKKMYQAQKEPVIKAKCEKEKKNGWPAFLEGKKECEIKHAFDEAEQKMHEGRFTPLRPLEFFEAFDEPFQRYLEKKAINALKKSGVSLKVARFLVKIITRWPSHIALFKFAPMAAYHYFSKTGEDQKRAALKEMWRSSHSWFASEVSSEIVSYVGYERFLKCKDWTLGLLNSSLILNSLEEGGRWGFSRSANYFSMNKKRYYDKETNSWRNDGTWTEDDFGGSFLKKVPEHITQSVISHVLFKAMTKSKLCNKTIKWMIEKVKGKVLDAFEARIDRQVEHGLRSLEDAFAAKQMIGLCRSEAFSQLFMFFGPDLLAGGSTMFVSILEICGKISEGTTEKYGKFLGSFMPTTSFEKFEIEASGDIFHLFDFMISKGIATLVTKWLWINKNGVKGPGTRWLESWQTS
jgi:hypothetical protein